MNLLISDPLIKSVNDLLLRMGLWNVKVRFVRTSFIGILDKRYGDCHETRPDNESEFYMLGNSLNLNIKEKYYNEKELLNTIIEWLFHDKHYELYYNVFIEELNKRFPTGIPSNLLETINDIFNKHKVMKELVV